ncbi:MULTISPECIES: alpha/beta hydrolase [sulfur-oxidizing symbionts]|nr:MULTISPECIES: alpha/beta hydrolase [sulfur-oxidizing symbionts]USF89231.1 alpha/beta hydrolase [Candidatus Endoriftia persephone]
MEWLWKLLPLGIAGYVAFSALVYFMQPGMIFYPNIPGRGLVTTPKSIGLDYEDVELITDDGTRIHGWFIPNSKASDTQKQATLLFLHGNAGNISHRLDSIKLFNNLGLDILIIDYRGYGQSTGKPTEAGTYQDAEAAWHYLTATRGIKENKIILFGRSLGGSISAWLASQHTPAALIVESSFSSAHSMGQRIYPFLPVRLLSRFQYNTKEYVKAIHCPVLVAHSRDDDIIPYEEGRDIFNSAHEPRYFLKMRGGHNDGFIISGSSYVDALESFINTSVNQQNMNTQ